MSAVKQTAVNVIPESPSRVLIAEDEHLVAVELTRSLASTGLTTVGPVSSGDAAIALAINTSPDIALLDVNMPGRSGISVAKELFETRCIPSVIISAYSDEEFIKGAQESGVFAYLVKPVADEQLRAALRIAWSRYRDLMNSRSEADDLRQRLADRRVIESAKWILVSKKGMSEPDAMRALQKHARDSRKTLVEVAQGLIDADSLLDPRPPTTEN
ncbi:MAG: ANTAR domain-containing response regulator [Phycisphaerales bacterium]|jgi:response regulator NasT